MNEMLVKNYLTSVAYDVAKICVFISSICFAIYFFYIAKQCYQHYSRLREYRQRTRNLDGVGLSVYHKIRGRVEKVSYLQVFVEEFATLRFVILACLFLLGLFLIGFTLEILKIMLDPIGMGTMYIVFAFVIFLFFAFIYCLSRVDSVLRKREEK